MAAKIVDFMFEQIVYAGFGVLVVAMYCSTMY